MTTTGMWRQIFACVVTMAALTVAPTGARAGLNVWTTAGPEGGSISALVVDPRTQGVLYAGTDSPSAGGSLYESTTSASIWIPTNNGLGEFGILALVIDPQIPATLYAGSFYGGVFRSTNGAATWSPASSVGLRDRGILALAVNTSGVCLHAGTGSGGRDGGPDLRDRGERVGDLLRKRARRGARRGGRLQFVTSMGLVVGNVSDLRSFRAVATNQPLATPFSVSQSSVFTHQWTADDPRGSYVFFVVAVRAGALAGSVLAGDQILRVATAPFTLP